MTPTDDHQSEDRIREGAYGGTPPLYPDEIFVSDSESSRFFATSPESGESPGGAYGLSTHRKHHKSHPHREKILSTPSPILEHTNTKVDRYNITPVDMNEESSPSTSTKGPNK